MAWWVRARVGVATTGGSRGGYGASPVHTGHGTVATWTVALVSAYAATGMAAPAAVSHLEQRLLPAIGNERAGTPVDIGAAANCLQRCSYARNKLLD